MNIKKHVGTAFAALALSVGGASSVQAEAIAVSIVDFSNFTVSRTTAECYFGGCANFLGSPGTTPTLLDRTNFLAGDTGLTFTSTADTEATLDGANASDAGSSSDGTPLDLFSSVGAPGYVDNAFNVIDSTNQPAGNFAAADQDETGAPISGLVTDLGDPVSAPARLRNASYVSLTGTGEGTSQSNNGLIATMRFVPTFTDRLLFSFDLYAYVGVFLSAGTDFPSFAQASYSVSLLLEEVIITPTGETRGPDLLNQGPLFGAPFNVPATLADDASASTPGSGFDVSDDTQNSGPYNFLTNGALLDGRTYQLTARINTAADAKFIPEPDMLAIFGLGLLGLGFYGRRRSAAKA